MAQAAAFFPNRYGKWDAHFAGGLIAKEIADILNRSPMQYGRVVDALNPIDKEILHTRGIEIPEGWTPWLVACVLFMDGY